ncbi:MAG: branched-chain amino acid transaminase [Deltaproteobacteria bacterium]|jgi:branched-chain amino acid aminotransferase|nr:branched-chain amino acid transaminase [Deltaproteobacteria bacterium]
MVDKVDKIWFDGKLIPWEQANVHVLTHTLHYGLGVFEGIRCYRLHDGRSAIFRLEEHIRRLFDSAHICMLPMPYTQDEIVEACLETVRENGLDECYLRPIAFMGDGEMGLGARTNKTHVSVIAWRWGAYLGEDGLKRGIRAKVSSFHRAGVNALMSKGKINGHYVNSILAKREVQAIGYDEAIMLDTQGYVSEASGENIFVVRDGEVATPPMGVSILGGITRNSVIRVMQGLGLTIHERLISRDELYIADEVFMVGTAAEVTPVRELDDRKIGSGSRGPITERVQAAYFDAVRGVNVPDESWLALV